MKVKLRFYWPVGTFAAIIFGRYFMDHGLLLAFGGLYLAVGLMLEWLVRTKKGGNSNQDTTRSPSP
jgi:hypothetical protein